MKKKEETYLITPKGFFIKFVNSEPDYDKLEKDLFLFMFKNNFNALVVEDGQLTWARVRKENKNVK